MTSVATPTGDRLTRAHKEAQRRLSADVSRQVLGVWGTVDPVNVDAAWPVVSRSLARVITDAHARSAQLAAAYMREHAAANGVALVDVDAAPGLDATQVDTALRVTGPVAVKTAAGAGMSPADAVASALVQLSGASSRLALAGGRDTITRTANASPLIVGYRRVGDGHSCYFCAMLISRGSVYKTHETAELASGARGNQPQGHAFHDHCGCTSEPLYSHQDEPAEVQRLQQLWQDVTPGRGPKADLAAWRAHFEAGASETRSPILTRDLTVESDESLTELLGTATSDAEVDAVVVELDRRDMVAREAAKVEADKAKRKAAQDAKRDAEIAAKDAEYDRLIESGVDPESAFSDAYGVDVEQQRRDAAIASLRSNGYKGRGFDELSRAAFRDYVEQSYYDAEAATRGALLNGTRGVNETRDPRRLFDGSEAYARANASEELLAYWRDHGRLTLDDMRASLLGGRMKMRGVAAWL